MKVEVRANQGIRKNDVVRVISGRERTKTGKVLEILTKRNRLVIEKVNMMKCHKKPDQKNRQGGIMEKEASIHLSNVMLVSRGKEETKGKSRKETSK